MKRVRVIPVLTLQNEKLVKTIKFNKPNYIGDPINAVKIFNEKEVDEIIILDITASKENREPNYKKIEEIASEAFMPFAYGGGINNLNQIEKLFKIGIEKIVLNTALQDINLIRKAAEIYGTQSIVASLDFKKSIFGKQSIYFKSGTKKLKENTASYIKKIQDAGIGEIIINSIDRDGTFLGYDLDLINQISKQSNVPIVACGGASTINDFEKAVSHGASAVAAGSMFVYRSASKGILINYPSQEELNKWFNRL